MTLLCVKNLAVSYHTRKGTLAALRDINFNINAGEILGVVGESGCGKSTVAYSLMGLLSPNAEITGGCVEFKGEDLLAGGIKRMQDFWGKDVSMIFQDPMTSLNPVFTVEDQLMTALRSQRGRTKKTTAELKQWMLEMLNLVGIPDAERRIKEYPHQFSGGMRQRIMIAMALLSRPSLLIADEPTSALDVTLEAQINDLIRSLVKELGTSVLYITHDLGVVAQTCDRVLVMYAGNIVESGSIDSVFLHPKHPYTQALFKAHPLSLAHATRLNTIPGRVPSLRELPLGCKFAPRCAYVEDVCRIKEPKETRLDEQAVLCHNFLKIKQYEQVPCTGKQLQVKSCNEGEGTLEKRQEVIVTVKELEVHFSDKIPLLGWLTRQAVGVVRAVDGININIFKGEILALVGESGCGKTTLGRSILRLTDSTNGEIIINGESITGLTAKEIRPLRAKMQMIFQDPISSLSPRMKVSSLLLEPFLINKIEVKEPEKKVEELLDMVGLSGEQADKYSHQLSGGQARRVSIARALALCPEILIADEPTAGLDVSVAADILNLLKDLRDKFNLTYIIITHNLNVINYIADRVGVMYLGKMVELATAEELFSSPKHPYTEALLSAISVPDPSLRGNKQRIILKGEIPSPRKPPSGCPFHTRCVYMKERCSLNAPSFVETDIKGHLVACHFIK